MCTRYSNSECEITTKAIIIEVTEAWTLREIYLTMFYKYLVFGLIRVRFKLKILGNISLKHPQVKRVALYWERSHKSDLQGCVNVYV